MIRRIAALVEATGNETVVEIGAGLGFLTAELARSAGRVIALEIDPRLVSALQDRFAEDARVEIVSGDVLAYDFSSPLPDGKIKVIGNIPYHISTPILFHLLAFRRSISAIVLMLQKELADRIMSPPGSKAYGIPSVVIARYASISREMNVPPTCFFPEPGVVSSVLRIVMREDEVTPEEESCFSMTVRAAFARRRKTLWNNLHAAGFAEDTLERVLSKTGIDGVRRAETLTVDEFDLLARELAATGSTGKNLDNWRGL
jgi:16S rRNA (adenine1518-N6/adenine1519-N6)-dimethyltransferase